MNANLAMLGFLDADQITAIGQTLVFTLIFGGLALYLISPILPEVLEKLRELLLAYRSQNPKAPAPPPVQPPPIEPTLRICNSCQTPLPPDAPQGLCPACLMKAGLGTNIPPPADSPTLKPGGSSSASDSSAPSVAEVAKLFPQLEVLELLGAGGMGAVYKARQPQLDRLVALKIMRAEISRNPAFAERFAREARALAKLNHPNIVSVYDFGQAGGHCWFIMEFMDGTNLRSVMRAGKVSPREALAIVPKICDALQYAHDEGIVHRDIKPENILLDTKGRVKIADFGLAKLVGPAPEDFALTATGMTLGTPRYMAPEQFEKPQEVDHRADIYSLGVVFYEMLTGELPMGRFAPPSAKVQVDVRIDEVVLRTLERDVHLRYQHASDVKTQVENISGVMSSLPPTMRGAFGFDYKSKTELFGLPLVNICSGTDPTTGRVRVAKGIIAIGDMAKGVVALGGVATGVFAFGGVAFGAFAFGGTAIGLFSFGGLALALVFAIGGLAAAPYVFAGIGIGYVAVGGMVFGVHTAGGNADDPVAKAFFVHFRLWHLWFTGMGLSLLSIPVSFGGMAWGRRRASSANQAPPAQPGARTLPQTPGAPAPNAANNATEDSETSGERESVPFNVQMMLCLFAVLVANGIVNLVKSLIEFHGSDDVVVFFILTFISVFILARQIYCKSVAARNAGGQMIADSVSTEKRESRTQPDFRQQDAREILALVMTVLTGLSIVGVIAAAIGLARVLVPAFRTDMEVGSVESLRLDAFEFVGMLALSLMALFLLPKARLQGRDRLARVNASNLIIVGVLLTVACTRHWFGLAVPYWLGGFYFVVALVCWIILRGRDVKAAFTVSSGQAEPAGVHRGGRRFVFITGAAVLVVACAVTLHELQKQKTRGSEQPIFYTFAHMDDFERGPDGPRFSKSKIKQLGLTPAQAQEVNKLIPKYYEEFVALEKQHTTVTKDDRGHVVITISPFREETISLAARLNADVIGLTGKDIIHLDWQGNLRAFGLFRHCGETTITAELWKEPAKAWSSDPLGGTYHFEEKHADNSRSRGGRGDNWKTVFPEEYWSYWNESAAGGNVLTGNDASAPAASLKTNSPPSAQKSEQPIFYTFGGETGFVKGPDGPIYSKAKVQEFGFTPLQTEEVNKITPRYYRDFLSLERQHATVKTDANGRVQVTITPFRDEAIALAERMMKEIRGTTGKDIVPGGYSLRGVGIVGFLRLFRHEGTREVKAELWKDSNGYHFTEAFGTETDEFGGKRSGGSRTLHGKDWKEAFPEEYWIYWNEK